MAACAYYLAYLAAGVFCVRCLLPWQAKINRIWLGLCFGTLLMMWLPALVAFVDAFSVRGHLLALLLLALVCLAAYIFRSRHAVRKTDKDDKRFLIYALPVVILLGALMAYLQYTHTIRAASDGSLWVGQATYGDLNMHLSFITSSVNARFPLDYALMTGQRLSYPFLMDTFSGSLYLLGMSLQMSVILPGTLFTMLVVYGYMALARQIVSSNKVVLLSALFVFINGGLGFLYTFDMSFGNLFSGRPEFMERLDTVMNGFYQTPTNMPELNLRWSNLIADLLLPQRTFLGGWLIVIPCIFLLFTAFAPEKQRYMDELDSGTKARQMVFAGIMAGLLPLLHTHSFLALGLISVGWVTYDLVRGRKKLYRTGRPWLFFLVVTLILSLPQLMGFTFRQVGEGSHFLSFHFNWVNAEAGGLKDGYLWFYIKNIGIPFVLLVLALFEKNKTWRFVACGAFVVFILAEFVQLTPNEYDNNKLFYIWYLLMAAVAADYGALVYRRMRAMPSRRLIAAGVVAVSAFSGSLSIARECVSNYQDFDSEMVAAADYARANMTGEDVVITGREHINPIVSLAGKRIVYGSSLYLYWHGLVDDERERDVTRFFESPEESLEVIKRYSVDYVYVGPYERSDYNIDEGAIAEMYPCVFESESGSVRIYKVTGGEEAAAEDEG
ncbi:MAG: hypothetical protein PHI27_01315 [Eubacteriales bacterium]|nr:hypothetical protein [Eubacteriales bacterium]MDD3880874.1 hypothetical protein [Eubacteriales bacterium]MDD4511759.1 hypothetical protein [Eubacteriales bacterium]